MSKSLQIAPLTLLETPIYCLPIYNGILPQRMGNLILPVSMGICMLSTSLFARSFLETGPRTTLDRVLKVMIYLSLVLIIQVFVLPYREAVSIDAIWR